MSINPLPPKKPITIKLSQGPTRVENPAPPATVLSSKKSETAFILPPTAQPTAIKPNPKSETALIPGRSTPAAAIQPPAKPEPAPAVIPATTPTPPEKMEKPQPAPALAEPAPKSQPAPAAAKVPTKPAPKSETPAKSKTPPADKPKQGSSGSIIFFVIGLLVLGGVGYYFGVLPRVAASGQLDQEQKLSTERHVIFVPAKLATPKSELPLPGTIDAFQQASIFARTTGYVKSWKVDIGDQVKEGDLLAELDTPEVDQQLSQAQSTAEQAKAAVDIAQTAASRWDEMVKAKAVSQEEADERDSTLKQATATYNADQANVQQLTATENFKQIRAPFAGTITFRHIEVGNLVTAGSGTTANVGTEIFRIAQIDPLRIYVDVPEANAPSVQPGVEADVHVQAYPDRVFKGTVVRNAGALDNASRTLRTEIDVPNKDGALLPGAYADVHLELVDKTPAVLIPANTLIVNSAGTQVAMLEDMDNADKDHFKVHILPVKVGRDFGTQVEILNNVKEGDRLITNPAADLNDGAVVNAKLLAAPPPPAAPPATTPQKS